MYKGQTEEKAVLPSQVMVYSREWNVECDVGRKDVL
jgi:hypothetical protein